MGVAKEMSLGKAGEGRARTPPSAGAPAFGDLALYGALS